MQCDVFYSHRPDPFLVSFQRLAIELRMGVMHPSSQLVVHPVFGPWFALRFALVVRAHCSSDDSSLVTTLFPPAPPHFALGADETAAVARILDGQSCYDPLRHVATRRAFITGKEHSYSDEQISYHYQLPLTVLSEATSNDV